MNIQINAYSHDSLRFCILNGNWPFDFNNQLDMNINLNVLYSKIKRRFVHGKINLF